MAHDHGNEYQIRVVREGGIEELSGWMKSTDEVTRAILTVPRTEEKTLWLMVRNTPGSGCPDKEQIVEYPITHIRSPRCIPHDSRYLQAMESNDRNYLDRSEFLITKKQDRSEMRASGPRFKRSDKSL